MEEIITSKQNEMRKLPWEDLADQLDAIYGWFLEDRQTGSRNTFAIIDELWYVLDALAAHQVKRKISKSSDIDPEEVIGAVTVNLLEYLTKRIFSEPKPESASTETSLRKLALSTLGKRINHYIKYELYKTHFSGMSHVPEALKTEAKLYTLSLDTPLGDEEDDDTLGDTVDNNDTSLRKVESSVQFDTVMSKIAVNVIHFQKCRGVGYPKSKKWFYPMFYTEQIASVCEGQKALENTPKDILYALQRDYFSYFADGVPENPDKGDLRQVRCRASVVLPSGEEQKVTFHECFLPAAIPMGYSQLHGVSAHDSLISNLRKDYRTVIRNWGME